MSLGAASAEAVDTGGRQAANAAALCRNSDPCRRHIGFQGSASDSTREKADDSNAIAGRDDEN